MIKPINTYVTQKRLSAFVVWACDEKRRHKHCQACNNNEGGREETSRKAQTEVDEAIMAITPDRDNIGKGTQRALSSKIRHNIIISASSGSRVSHKRDRLGTHHDRVDVTLVHNQIFGLT